MSVLTPKVFSLYIQKVTFPRHVSGVLFTMVVISGALKEDALGNDGEKGQDDGTVGV